MIAFIALLSHDFLIFFVFLCLFILSFGNFTIGILDLVI